MQNICSRSPGIVFLEQWPLQSHLRSALGFVWEGKESACNVRDPHSIPGSGRSPGEGNGYPLQYSCQENSMDSGAWWAPGGLKELDMTNTFTLSLQRPQSLGDGAQWSMKMLCYWKPLSAGTKSPCVPEADPHTKVSKQRVTILPDCLVPQRGPRNLCASVVYLCHHLRAACPHKQNSRAHSGQKISLALSEQKKLLQRMPPFRECLPETSVTFLQQLVRGADLPEKSQLLSHAQLWDPMDYTVHE